MTAERVLMGLLIGGIGIGCTVVLYPFISAILWAAILTFTTWPVFEWLRGDIRLGRTAAAGAMVTITAVVVVLPLALAAPGVPATWRSCRRRCRTRWPPGCQVRRAGWPRSRWSGRR